MVFPGGGARGVARCGRTGRHRSVHHAQARPGPRTCSGTCVMRKMAPKSPRGEQLRNRSGDFLAGFVSHLLGAARSHAPAAAWSPSAVPAPVRGSFARWEEPGGGRSRPRAPVPPGMGSALGASTVGRTPTPHPDPQPRFGLGPAVLSAPPAAPSGSGGGRRTRETPLPGRHRLAPALPHDPGGGRSKIAAV